MKKSSRLATTKKQPCCKRVERMGNMVIHDGTASHQTVQSKRKQRGQSNRATQDTGGQGTQAKRARLTRPIHKRTCPKTFLVLNNDENPTKTTVPDQIRQESTQYGQYSHQ